MTFHSSKNSPIAFETGNRNRPRANNVLIVTTEASCLILVPRQHEYGLPKTACGSCSRQSRRPADRFRAMTVRDNPCKSAAEYLQHCGISRFPKLLPNCDFDAPRPQVQFPCLQMGFSIGDFSTRKEAARPNSQCHAPPKCRLHRAGNQ